MSGTSNGGEARATPSVPVIEGTGAAGSVWTRRVRVLGVSKVWPDEFVVCEMLTGERTGERCLLNAHDFSRMTEELDA